jgi:hypothetical protein
MVGDTLALVLRQAQHTDFALVQVSVHLKRCLACLIEGERARKHRVNHALGNQAIRFVRLSIVGKV